MKRKTTINTTLCILLGAGLIFYLHQEPHTKALESDLENVRLSIEQASEEEKLYGDGLIASQISMRKSILQNTEAMLSQKKSALLRRINLKYTIDGRPFKPASPEQLAEIEKDIQSTEAEINASTAEASLYNGGLILVTILARAETQKMTLALLKSRYYAEKHGIPLSAPQIYKEPKTTPGNITSDSDAM